MFPLGNIIFKFTLYYERKLPIVIALLQFIRNIMLRNSSTASTWKYHSNAIQISFNTIEWYLNGPSGIVAKGI